MFFSATPDTTCNIMQAKGWGSANKCREIIKNGYYYTSEAVDLCNIMVSKGWSAYGNSCLETIVNHKYTLSEISFCKVYIQKGYTAYILDCLKNSGVRINVPTIIENAQTNP